MLCGGSVGAVSPYWVWKATKVTAARGTGKLRAGMGAPSWFRWHSGLNLLACPSEPDYAAMCFSFHASGRTYFVFTCCADSR